MSKSTFSDSTKYVQRYEDISTKPAEKPVYIKKKVSKASIIIGLLIVLGATLGLGALLSKSSASANNSHYDTSLSNNPTYCVGYDDGYSLREYNEAYTTDQLYKKGYNDGQEDAK